MPNIHDIERHLGEVYREIDQDVSRLHARWKLLIQLFGSQESVDILNASSPFSIFAIQESLMNSVLLRITKLTDPANSNCGRFANVSFANLLNNLPDDATPDLIDNLTAKLGTIKNETEEFRLLRHKSLAHRDAAFALDPDCILPGITKAKLRDVLKLFREFMHEIQKYYGWSGSLYENIELGRDGNSLLLHLAGGKKYIDLHEHKGKSTMNDSEICEQLKTLPSIPKNAV